MTSAGRIQQAVAVAQRGLVDRGALVELCALAAVAREHVLVIGPPGTAKSEAARRIAKALGGRYFEYLLGRFTEPSEIFGPIDLRRLREGVVETEVRGMLPEAEIAFLDEVFLGSTAILNTLLGVLNERTFRRGHTQLRVPLRVCVGASNAIPDDPSLAAFADRFLVRVYVESVADPLLEELLAGGASLTDVTAVADIAALDDVAAIATAADLTGVRPIIAEAVRKLRSAGVTLTDRRVVKLQRLVAAAAALAGRTTPTAADVWPIVHAVPDAAGQDLARDVLRDVLAQSDNAALPNAAEEASLGRLARARRLVGAADALLAEADHRGAWRLKVEGVLREVDAAFATPDLPADLADLRGRLITALGGA